MAQTILNDLRQRLKQLYGPRLVRLVLYGSQARGDAEEESDVDVLVVLDGEVRPGEEIRRTGGIIAELSLVNDVVHLLRVRFQQTRHCRQEPTSFERPQGRGFTVRSDQEQLLKKAHESLSAHNS